MKIFLIGFMGCGKTTTGKILAQKLNYSFFDTDNEISSITGKSISEIFKDKGESYFRELEKLIIQNLENKDNCVISCGGGLPCHNNLMNQINRQGISIYLKLSSNRLFERLKNDTNNRPLLNGKKNSEMQKFISDLLNEREYFYLQSKFKLSLKEHNPEQVADAIIKLLS